MVINMKLLLVSVSISLIFLSCLPEKLERSALDPTGIEYDPLQITLLEGPEEDYAVVKADELTYRFAIPSEKATMTYKYMEKIRPVADDGSISFMHPKLGFHSFFVNLSYPDGSSISQGYNFIKVGPLQTAIYVIPEFDSVETSSSFNVEIVLSEMPPISDMNFTISFNTDSLQYSIAVILSDKVLGSFFAGDGINIYKEVDNNSSAGEISFNIGIKNNDGNTNNSGSGRLATLRFYSKDLIGETKIDILENIVVMNSADQTIPVNIISKGITVY